MGGGSGKEYGEEFETVEPALQQYLALLASACPLDISSLFRNWKEFYPDTMLF